MQKTVIETTKYTQVVISLELVFKANLNDSYYLGEQSIPFADLQKEELVWFSPFHGRPSAKDKKIALLYCSDEGFTLLEKVGDTIEKQENIPLKSGTTVSDDFDKGSFFWASIKIQ